MTLNCSDIFSFRVIMVVTVVIVVVVVVIIVIVAVVMGVIIMPTPMSPAMEVKVLG